MENKLTLDRGTPLEGSTLGHESIDGKEMTRRVLFLHGILGRGSNWRSIARKLVQARPDWGALLVDLRMHGTSLNLAPPHTLQQCAKDLLGVPNDPPVAAVIGHSFGGKVALAYARLRGDLTATYLIDSSPSPGARTGTVAQVLDALNAGEEWFADRSLFVASLTAKGIAEPIARWLAMSLVREGEQLRFGPDLAAIEALLEDYWRTDAWGVVEAPDSGVHMVIGGDSDVFSDADIQRARDSANVHTIEGAGHWVHVDAPKQLLKILANGLPR